MTYILIGLVIILLIALKSQRTRNLKEQIDWIIRIVSSDGYVSESEKEMIRKFADDNNLSSTQIIQSIESKASDIKPQVEPINWNRKNGLDFENTIAELATHKDDHSSYEVYSWTGDKYVNGNYDKSNCDPDIIIQVKLSSIEKKFALECKWRKGFNNQGYIEIAKPYQLNHYKKYQEEWKVPIFIALGVGGKGQTPENIYLIPLDEIKYCEINEEWAQKFKRPDCHRKLFFNVTTSSLS